MKLKDLKVGDFVYIRQELENAKKYGAHFYFNNMGKGLQQIQSINTHTGNFNIFGKGYHFSPEMVDWEKTAKLNNSSCFKEITQYGGYKKEATKWVTYDGEEITVKNNGEENDTEKAVMLLMLKNLGVTYSEIKKEVEKVKVKWRPTEDDRYYYIRDIGDIRSCFWSESSWDYYRFDFNNCFKTKEEAEEKLEKIKEVLKGE